MPQFEITEYLRQVLWRSVRSAQLKGGYWDQNIRPNGSFLPRGGGLPYSNAWSRVNRARVSRVYVESWNEYDEGTGIYAASAGPPYIKPGSGNTNTDVWSRANDPYEYIRTTARGAAAFNDWPERDAKILWHDIPARMLPGETRTAAVIVRNEGDALWSEVAKYRFGQKDTDPVKFGAGRYLLNDTQDDIPTFGGIFRGRARTFTLTLQAPTTPGLYTNHWSMLQENVTWFGQELVQIILVDPTPIYHGAPQAIDSTALFTNRVDDFTEHTYAAHNTAGNGILDCAITRTFAALIKSIKVSIVSGTADDIGYVGGILVTSNSFGTTCRLGYVTNTVDVTRAVSVNGNSASLTLRAQDSCPHDVGWGEDTVSGRANAKLHWQVEPAPPVPISQVFSNAANGHYYVLLSPATWTWSERAAVALGGHLATVRSQAEDNWVTNIFSRFGGTNHLLWIGCNDVANEGHFVWSSGEPAGFTAWAPGEPNNALGGEDFAAIYPPGHPYAGLWNDWGERALDGNGPFDGVVELVPPNGPPRVTAQPQGGLANLTDKFRFSVAASGSPSLRYQWRLNGTNLIGATGSSLVLKDVQFSDRGSYSVLVTNALGSVLSSDAVLVVNRPPVAPCRDVIVSADDNCVAKASMDNGSFDPDGDPIALSQSPPGPYPLGTNTVTLTVTDNRGASSTCAARVIVRDTTPPAILCPADLSMTNAHDAWTSGVSFAPTVSDNCSGVGQPVCTPAPGSAFGLGRTGVNCSVRDATGYSSQCSFTVTVYPGNKPPVPVITVSPLVQLRGWTNLLVISPNNENAAVVFDGSQSYDSDDATFKFFWYEGTNLLSTNVVTTNALAVGPHTVTLRLDDTFPLGTNSAAVTFEIIRPSRAVAQIYALLEDAGIPPRRNDQLYACLNAAIVEFERSRRDRFKVGVRKLEAFIQKVQAQVAPVDPALAEELVRLARQIVETVQGG